MSESAFVAELKERGLYEEALEVCQPLAVRLDELRDRSRFATVVEARRRFAQHMKDKHQWNAPLIARLLGRDTSTVQDLLTGKKRGGSKRRR